MLRLLTLAAAAGAAAVAMSVSPAGAITGNFEQDFVHNYVGLIAFYDANGDFVWRCSGALLNPTTVLTAGHCTDSAGGARTAIGWFSQEGGKEYNPATGAEDPHTGYPNECLNSATYPCATSHTLLEYGFTGLNMPGVDDKDVGLVILDQPITPVGGFPSLAEAGSVDQLATKRGLKNVTFTASGYGVSAEKPVVVSFRERLMATLQLVNTGNRWGTGFDLQLSTNPGNGKGGTCFGDSGGPILYDDTDTIVGVNSWVFNNQCGGVGFAYRTDQQAVINWIQAHADDTYGGIGTAPLS